MQAKGVIHGVACVWSVNYTSWKRAVSRALRPRGWGRFKKRDVIRFRSSFFGKH